MLRFRKPKKDRRILQPGSRSGSFYNSPEWRLAREAALKRDNYRCTVCGVDVSGVGQSRVDHIKTVLEAPELRLELANLRTLCVLHDGQAHRERRSGGPRRAQFRITGCDADGNPLDPAHHWNQPAPDRSFPPRTGENR